MRGSKLKPSGLSPSARKRRKPKRVLDRVRLQWIHDFPCVVPGCDARNVEADHVGDRAFGLRCGDDETLPVCVQHHRLGREARHVLGKNWWKHHGINRTDLLAHYAKLYAEFKQMKAPPAKAPPAPAPPTVSLAIETWPLHEILPYEKNARTIPQSAIEKVSVSLKEFGWRQPMVVDANGVLIVGHARRMAAVHLGWTDGPVHVARDLSEDQIKAYRLMDNRSHQETGWNQDLLAEELASLQRLDCDLTLTGFDQEELDKLLSPPIPPDEYDPGDQEEKLVECPACGHTFQPKQKEPWKRSEK